MPSHLLRVVGLPIPDALQLNRVRLDVGHLAATAARSPIGAGVEGEPDETHDQQTEHNADQNREPLQVALHPEESCHGLLVVHPLHVA